MDLFEMVAAERRALADVIEKLTDAQLQTPSLVPTWTVRDVAGHLALTLDLSVPKMLWTFLTTRSLMGTVDKMTWERAKHPVPELVATLRKFADSRKMPPGGSVEHLLTEQVVHGLDLCKPLKIEHKLGEDRLRPVLDMLFKTPARPYLKTAWRDGLRYEATDLSWSHGEGPTLRGTTDLLILAVTGRAAILGELQGEGVDVLRQRYALPQ
ncbi:MAG: maleylpyruvate isomerase family mycothiol-dependent enzyme [Myxococcales bacterium]